MIVIRDGTKELLAFLPTLERLYGDKLTVRILSDSQAAIGSNYWIGAYGVGVRHAGS